VAIAALACVVGGGAATDGPRALARARHPVAGADLRVAARTVGRLQGGIPSRFAFTLSNAGPMAARRVRLTLRLSTAGRVLDVRAKGIPRCKGDEQERSYACTLPLLRSRRSAQVGIVAFLSPGRVRIRAAATSQTRDQRPANNATTLKRSAVPPSRTADLGVTLEGVPARVAPGRASYMIRVTNHGPDAAHGVIAAPAVEANAIGGIEPPTVAAAASQGSCPIGQSCKLGAIAPGASAAVSVVVTFKTPALYGVGGFAGGALDAYDPGFLDAPSAGYPNRAEATVAVESPLP
jgi:Domain of unknown function DUF11